MALSNIASELRERGLIEQEGGGEAKNFLGEKRTVYLGIDPTADSLHLGNLVPIILMRHLALAGHNLVFIVGGGTGMIGDPRESGERTLLDEREIAKNTKAIAAQLTRILGSKRYVVRNNASWLAKLTLIEFLRDTAKHFTVNQLVKRDIIKRRLDAEDPLSFTEFSYSLLQAYDFLYLNRKDGVDMQVGGSDQWANIISGVDLVRRKAGASVYALTTPIITDRKTGKKFGKSEGNAVWLDGAKTSPFAFYQFWLNVADENASEYLNIFSFLPLGEIARILDEHASRPGERLAQKKLAFEVTKLVHGEDVALRAERASQVVFGNLDALTALPEKEIRLLVQDIPGMKMSRRDVARGVSPVDALVGSALAASKSEAQRLIVGKGVSINGTLIDEPTQAIVEAQFIRGIALLRAGKKVALLSFR